MREETSIKSRWRSICISKRSSGLQSVPADAPFAIITQTVPHNWISKHTGGTCRLPISCSSIIFFLDMSNTTRETHFEYASANALVQSLTLHMCVTTKNGPFYILATYNLGNESNSQLRWLRAVGEPQAICIPEPVIALRLNSHSSRRAFF